MLTKFQTETNLITTGPKYNYKLSITCNDKTIYQIFKDISIADIFDSESLISDEYCWLYVFDFLDEIAKECNIYSDIKDCYGDSIGFVRDYTLNDKNFKVELNIVD